jgi:ElaB/YqjD/DUF883 family membrane-anchored ribosome-binding protein
MIAKKEDSIKEICDKQDDIIKELTSNHNNEIAAIKKENKDLIDRNDKNMKDLIDKYDKNMKELIIRYEDKIQELMNKLASTNKTIYTNNGTITQNISYCNEHFPDAPALLPISNFKIRNTDYNNLVTDEDYLTVVQDIIYYNTTDTLYQFLGNHIINIYKLKDKLLQSIYAVDVARINYILKLFLTNGIEMKDNSGNNVKKTSYWVDDKQGLKLSELIIEPLVNKIEQILNDYTKKVEVLFKKNNRVDPCSIEYITFKDAALFILNFNKYDLIRQINRYIAPHFTLDKTPFNLENNSEITILSSIPPTMSAVISTTLPISTNTIIPSSASSSIIANTVLPSNPVSISATKK